MQGSFNKLLLVAAFMGLIATGCGDAETSSKDANPSDAGSVAGLSTDSDSGSKLEKGWSTYESQGGRFSIAMPGSPKEEDRPVALPGGSSVPLKIASLEKRDLAYFTGYVDYPEGLVSNPNVNVQDVLSSSIEGATKADFGDGELKQQETSVSGIPCRSFETAGDLDGKAARMEGIFCLEGDRLFEVLIIGEDKSSFPAKAQQFISSFKIQAS